MYGRVANPPGEALAPARPSRRKFWLRGLQLLLTAAAFAYVLSLVSFDALADAVSRLPLWAFAVAMALNVASLTLGAVRWWLLFRAFGAPHPPTFARVCRFYLVGFFYNVYLPGGVGGDVVRALASKSAWGGERAATAGLATVLVERILGLAGLLGLISMVSLVHPLPVLGSALLPGVLGLCGAALPVVTLPFAAWLAPRVPGLLGRLLERLPRIERALPLMAATALSLATQLLPALAGYVLVAGLAPQAELFDSLLIVPLASAAAFLPITVSGAGVREALFVKLYESVGIAAGTALAASLALWCAQACVAALGGLHALRYPLGDER